VAWRKADYFAYLLVREWMVEWREISGAIGGWCSQSHYILTSAVSVFRAPFVDGLLENNVQGIFMNGKC
jgi:hypothetical protein